MYNQDSIGPVLEKSNGDLFTTVLLTNHAADRYIYIYICTYIYIYPHTYMKVTNLVFVSGQLCKQYI